MQEFRYRIFFNNKPATETQLERVKEINVEQEVDMAWEARIKIPIFADKKGIWTAEDEDFMKPYSPVRVEIKIGSNPYVPLIDGPIVGFDSQMSSEPGQSSIILIVHDSSTYLNRLERTARFENSKIEDIAAQLFAQSEHVITTDIANIPSSPNLPVVIQRGTDIQILRSIARRHGMHAFVLPGDKPGESIGCFKPFPLKPDGLQPLILMGEDRNILEFNIGNEAHRPSIFKASYLNTLDKSVTTSTSSFQDAELMGSEPVMAGKTTDTVQLLRNDEIFPEDLDQSVAARAADSSYSFKATGRVNNCYEGVLQPYRVVTVMGANGRLSGDYLISNVTHNLTLSTYLQSFTVKRNSRSAGSGGGESSNACGCSGGISGAISGSLSFEVSIS